MIFPETRIRIRSINPSKTYIFYATLLRTVPPLYIVNCVYRSLGVLLYTLVYGAMPFDGSNFKRLVKQITTGDYYEPKQPSSKILNT